ncbi:MAG TPA: hypothetical protein VEI83_08390, partial [Acidimicrobiales bacterium]|nr:hypothetical protein [Acidimicrobiales bacterium]
MLVALIGVVLIAAVIVAAAMSLFLRRHGEQAAPDPGWVATDEVFRDPASERLMRVWLDAEEQRHYVPERAGPGAGARGRPR